MKHIKLLGPSLVNRRTLFGALLFFFLALGCYAEDLSLGPVAIHNQYPISSLHASLAPEAPATLDEGELRLRLAGSWASTSILEDNYIIDGEGRTLSADIALGISDAVEAQLSLPFVWRSSGRLDPFIDGWHRFFSLPRGDRDTLPDKHLQISGQNEDGTDFDLGRAGGSLGNLETAFKVKIFERRSSAAAYRFGLNLPTAENGFGHQGIDLSNALLYSEKVGLFGLYIGASHVFLSDDRISGVEFRRNHVEGFLCAEYRVLREASLIVGLVGAQQVARGIDGHPAYSTYLDIGGRFYLGRGLSIETIVRENPSPGSGTSDVSFHLGLTSQYD